MVEVGAGIVGVYLGSCLKPDHEDKFRAAPWSSFGIILDPELASNRAARRT